MREKLSAVFSLVMEVNVLDSKDEANLALLARPELGVTFTKLHCWRLTQYEKCVFLDADTLVIRNCDELFEREELSAAPDVGWPDCFNSGVFVYRPSQQTFASITSFAAAKGSFDGGDQGLLNMYFSDWARKDISKHLPFIYNMCSTATYSYLPAFKQFGDDVRIIHFIGITKPWLQYFDTLTGIVQPPMGSAHLQPLLQLWWNIFCEKVHPQLSPIMGGLAGALAQMTLGEPRSAEQIALEEHMRKQSWEQGHIDYMGRDSFDNIWKKICETLALAPPRLPSPPKETQKPAKTVTDKTDESVKSSETMQSIEKSDEMDKEIAQATTNYPEKQSLVNNVPKTSVPKLPEKDKDVIDAASSVEKSEDDITAKIATKSEIETLDISIDPSPANLSMETTCKEIAEVSASSLLKEAPQQTTTPTSLSDLIQPCSIGEEKLITSTSELESNIEDVKDLKIATDTEQTKESDVKVEKHAKELSTASEILTVSPVPIQVAESVLQMEPKESMSDSQLVSQEVLSSTITPVHLTEDKMSINGSTALIDSTQDKEKSSSNITATVRDTETASKSSDSLKKSIETSQILLPVEQIESQHVETPVLSPENLETLEELIQKETTTQQSEKSESPIKETVESTESASSDKTPVRPSRAKEVTSPSTSVPKAAEQDSKSQEKGVKKAGKKSVEKPVTEGEPAETTEAESIEKKAGKKVVKKVVKKTKTKSEEGLDDSMEDGSSASKQKKTAKAVKKGTKSSQAPGTDTNVPESPSSSTSDAPVPPKRKTKATAVKSVTKKSDIEE
ncbi:glycogenin 1 isoform X3 [Xylocopa sonorina]